MEGAVDVMTHARVRGNPDAAVASFKRPAYEIVDQALIDRELGCCAAFYPKYSAPIGSYPQRPVPRTKNIAYVHVTHSGESRWNNPVADDVNELI